MLRVTPPDAQLPGRPFVSTAIIVLSTVVVTLGLVLCGVLIQRQLRQERSLVAIQPGQVKREVGSVQRTGHQESTPLHNKENEKKTALTGEEVVSLVSPSVVKIETDRGVTGSGFFALKQGCVVTNYHVIEGAKAATVLTNDGMTIPVEGWFCHAVQMDLVLLKVRTHDYPLLALANRRPSQGVSVWAFGAPKGLSGSVTDGIVSAVRVHRDLLAELPDRLLETISPDVVWIQTTAPISPGNSGGPLVSSDGKVVGVNSGSLRGQNLNLSISVECVSDLLKTATNTSHPLLNLPAARPDPTETARKEEDYRRREMEVAQQLEREEELKRIARIAEENRRAANQRQKWAIEAAEKASREEGRQRELQRISDQITNTRGELAKIDAAGTQLTALRGNVIARGHAATVAMNGLARQRALCVGRLSALDLAIRRRESSLRGGLVVLDGESAPHSPQGVSQLRAEAATTQLNLMGVDRELASLQASYAALDSQARDLTGQILFKAAQREQHLTMLKSLVDRYEALKQKEP